MRERGPVIAYVQSDSRPTMNHEIRLGRDGVLYCGCEQWRYSDPYARGGKTCHHMPKVYRELATFAARALVLYNGQPITIARGS